MPTDDTEKERLQVLLFQLSEQLKDPPLMIDLYDWRDTMEILMKEIKEISTFAYDRLDDLVNEAMRLAEKHVQDLDRDAPPKESEQSAMNYQEQIAFVTSEINTIKSL